MRPTGVEFITRRHRGGTLLQRLLRLMLLLPCAIWRPAAADRGATDRFVVQQSKLVASGEHVDVFVHGTIACPQFDRIADAGYRKLEQLTGRKFDLGTLGKRIRFYVSDAVPVSHVWRGYEHRSDPRGIVILTERACAGALDGTNATYAHEMTHLLMWRFNSHTLREGLADYLALQIHPRAGVGPNTGGHHDPAPPDEDVLSYLGTTRPPPARLMNDRSFRRSYYHASYRFAKLLIEMKDIGTFLQLYESAAPEERLLPLYGLGRDELIRRLR